MCAFLIGAFNQSDIGLSLNIIMCPLQFHYCGRAEFVHSGLIRLKDIR